MDDFRFYMRLGRKVVDRFGNLLQVEKKVGVDPFSGGNIRKTSDEFLVEKKSPLVMPPNFNELPFPKSNNQKTKKNEDTIESIILFFILLKLTDLSSLKPF